MLTQSELEQALDQNRLWAFNSMIGDYFLMVRKGPTKRTKNGFSIPATPGYCNHHMLKYLAKTHARPDLVISSTQPISLPVGSFYTLGGVPKALIN